ncbi:MAG: S-layer homology domain-containing protein [Candidatus Peribacteraceae bacterium]|nr:S-layer homology domain-containing protein [Candidatus Peribacteraceae bacterium]
MKRLISTLALALLPLTASAALDFSDISGQYEDGPFNLPQSVGISLLTREGVLEGNPDGTFRPSRTLNRAEFTAIVMRLKGGVDAGAAANCFPDVRASDWFSAAVCTAKALGIVAGNPDGTFRPANPVNYAEALKMMTLLFDYDVQPSGGEWYLRYASAARARGTTLPGSTAYDHSLTRGEMARLAAGFWAESEGELDDYRDAEAGDWTPPSSSSSSSTSSSSSSSSSSVSSSSSSSSSSTGWEAKSRLLLLGQMTQPVAEGNFGSDTEVRVQGAEVRFDRELTSVQGVTIVDALGQPLFTLQRQADEPGKRKIWRGTDDGEMLTVAANQKAKLGVVLDLKPADNGGVSEEFVLVQAFYVTITSTTNGDSAMVQSDKPVQPPSQTAFARITSVQNTMPDGALAAGKKREIGRFAFAGESLPDAELSITSLQLHLATANVDLANIGLKLADNQETSCSRSSSNPTLLTCPLPEGRQDVVGSMREVSVFADITIPVGSTPSLQVSLTLPGSLTDLGDIEWTDGVGHFRWVDLPSLPAGPWLD